MLKACPGENRVWSCLKEFQPHVLSTTTCYPNTQCLDSIPKFVWKQRTWAVSGRTFLAETKLCPNSKAVKNTVWRSLQWVLPPAINPDFMIGCRLLRLPTCWMFSKQSLGINTLSSEDGSTGFSPKWPWVARRKRICDPGKFFSTLKSLTRSQPVFKRSIHTRIGPFYRFRETWSECLLQSRKIPRLQLGLQEEFHVWVTESSSLRLEDFEHLSICTFLEVPHHAILFSQFGMLVWECEGGGAEVGLDLLIRCRVCLPSVREWCTILVSCWTGLTVPSESFSSLLPGVRSFAVRSLTNLSRPLEILTHEEDPSPDRELIRTSIRRFPWW